MPRWRKAGRASREAVRASHRLLYGAMALGLALANAASADDAMVTPPIGQARLAASERFKANYFLGDWGGMRTDLWAAGFEPTLLLATDPYGNPVGGREQGFTTYNLLCADLGIDAGRAAGWKGGRFDVGWSWNFGNRLSQDVVGNVFPIQMADVAPPGTRLTNLSWTQELWDGAVSVRAGRFSIDALYGQEFAGSDYFRSFTSVAFNAIPFSLFYNAPGPFGYPATTWGARVKVLPSDALCLMGGIFNADPEVDEADQHGLDFSLKGPALAIAEIGLRSNQSPGATGLPGNLKFGGYTLGGDVQEYDSTEESSGRYGFYVVGDQMVMRFGGVGDDRHLGVFGSVVVAPDESVSPMPYSAFGGFVAYGPMASRPKDFISFGVAYGGFSNELREAQRVQQLTDPSVLPQLFEMAIEASYGFQVQPGLLLQPGMQVIVNPGGSPDVDTAFAAGVNVVIRF